MWPPLNNLAEFTFGFLAASNLLTVVKALAATKTPQPIQTFDIRKKTQ
ncbi:exported hypothetical protein [Cupriavidus taiwanensis]|nr:exported hypothetical protein [Cupriavidus taiwanensis]